MTAIAGFVIAETTLGDHDDEASVENRDQSKQPRLVLRSRGDGGPRRVSLAGARHHHLLSRCEGLSQNRS
jgi:hypothetical protein